MRAPKGFALRILLDQNSPLGLRQILSGHEVHHSFALGWHQLENGDLIAAAEAAGFDIMVTADQNIRYQQNLTTRRLSLVVLGTTNWDTIRGNAAAIVAAVELALPGSYLHIPFGRPLLRRRPKPIRDR
ncbi:MAG: hypothetical protein ABSC06_02790 [Rhodopila sp.]